MAEEAHLQVIDQVLFRHYNHLLSVMIHYMIWHLLLKTEFGAYVGVHKHHPLSCF